MFTVCAVADVICDILTQSIFLWNWRSEDRAQLLRVSRKHQLTAPGIIGVQEVRHRDDTLRFCCMTRLVYENVREVISWEQCWHQPEKMMQKKKVLAVKRLVER